MAFSEELAERIRQGLARRNGIEEKKMFGGIGFLLNGNMLVGVWKDSLIVRLGPEEGEQGGHAHDAEQQHQRLVGFRHGQPPVAVVKLLPRSAHPARIPAG